LETADDKSILEVVALDEQGSQLLHHNQSAFIDHIHPILKDIHDKIQCPFAVIGLWPAQQFAHTCQESEESVSPDLECMVTNDIDCFFGGPGNGPFAMEGMPQKELINGNEVNWVKVHHFILAAGLLSNNDINATAFAIGVSEVNGMLSFEFEVSPHFWHSFFSQEHILSAVRPRHTKTRMLVQLLAFKSPEMHLPFDDCAIDSRSEKLPRSQKEKVDHLNRDWTGNPLSAYSINQTGMLTCSMVDLDLWVGCTILLHMTATTLCKRTRSNISKK
jgi:hypothetical protein